MIDWFGDISQLPMWLTFIIIIVTVISYGLERISIELTSCAALLALILTFTLLPVHGPSGDMVTIESLLSGFAHPVLFTILSLLIIGQALFRTHALDPVGAFISQFRKDKPLAAIAFILIIAMVVSSFFNNTPVVIMLVPILASLALARRIHTSQVMIPLSYASILGGMTTLVGSSTNLLVAGVAYSQYDITINFFDFTVPGAIMALVGMIYLLFILPRFLPQYESITEMQTEQSGRQFITEIPLTLGHPLIGDQAVSGLFPKLKTMTVRGIERKGITMMPPFDDIELEIGDTVILSATKAKLTSAMREWDSISHHAEEYNTDIDNRNFMIVEAIIGPGSRAINNTIDRSGLRNESNCLILGIQRRGHMQRKSMTKIRLQAGDVILLGGSAEDIKALRSSPDFIVLEWSATQITSTTYAHRAQFIMAFVIIAIATGILPVSVSAMIGAFLMVLTGCLNLRQAFRAIDSKVYFLIGTSLALTSPLDITGGTDFIADLISSTFANSSPTFILSVFFIGIAALTNVLSNSTTAILFTPIAINAAQTLAINPIVFIVTVILAANMSFASPIGYQTNLLVMGPGHYRFKDYVFAGMPLIFLMWLTFIIVVPAYYGLN